MPFAQRGRMTYGLDHAEHGHQAHPVVHQMLRDEQGQGEQDQPGLGIAVGPLLRADSRLGSGREVAHDQRGAFRRPPPPVGDG